MAVMLPNSSKNINLQLNQISHGISEAQQCDIQFGPTTKQSPFLASV